MRYLLIVLIAAMLTACGGGGSDQLGDDSQVTIDPPNCAASGVCL